MKKVRYIAIAVVVIAVIVLALMNNRAKIQAAKKAENKEVYYVSAAKAEMKQLNEDITFVGTVNANNDVNIISETQGKVTAVYAKVGDYKQAGSALVQVDDELKRSAFKLAEANYEKAKKDYERFQSLFQQKSASESQLDQAKLAFASAENQFVMARRQLNDTKITTPISGIVTARLVDMGTMISAGMNIGTVVDIGRLKIKVNVSEADAFKLKPGDNVKITSDVYPGISFDGKTETISSKGDEAHTYPVEIYVTNNSKNPLKAGMFARVNFTSLKRNQVLAIPRAAVMSSSRDAKVYVLENGIARLRPVITGSEFGTFVEVLGGIAEGEQVVTSGQNTLVPNVPVIIQK